MHGFTQIRRLIYLPHEAFAAAFAQNATIEEQKQLAAVQRPIALSCITVPVGRPLWKDRPSYFLLAEQDRIMVKETQLFMAERMKAKVRMHPVDHTPSVTAPGVVVDIILEALRDVSRMQNDSSANVIDRFTEVVGLDRFAVYVFDYGAPTGLRLAAMHPERITAIISQNGNASEEGLSEGWNPIRAYWQDSSGAHREALRQFLAPQTKRWQYIHGVTDEATVSPDGIALDNFYFFDTGHFALETNAEEIATAIGNFLKS